MAPLWTDPVNFVFEEQPAAAKLNAQILENLRWLKPLFARKTADESVTSSTGLQNDDHLVVAVDANATYELKMLMLVLGPAAADLKIQFAMPAGASLAVSVDYYDVNLVLSHGYFTNSAALAVGALEGVTIPVVVEGLLRVAGTAGNQQLQWAQSTSSATATKLLIDSYLRLRRVA